MLHPLPSPQRQFRHPPLLQTPPLPPMLPLLTRLPLMRLPSPGAIALPENPEANAKLPLPQRLRPLSAQKELARLAHLLRHRCPPPVIC
jgi:hypothetical protein